MQQQEHDAVEILNLLLAPRFHDDATAFSFEFLDLRDVARLRAVCKRILNNISQTVVAIKPQDDGCGFSTVPDDKLGWVSSCHCPALPCPLFYIFCHFDTDRGLPGTRTYNG